MIIHSGRFPDLRKASTTLRRLAAFAFFCIDLFVPHGKTQLNRHRFEVGLPKQLFRCSGAHVGAVCLAGPLQLFLKFIVRASRTTSSTVGP